MHRAKGTTPKALRIQQEAHNNNGVVDHNEPSFRVLYYGDASAGSVPFMWESQPGTPKHALTESSLPPLTPPPSFQSHVSPSMQLSKHKRSGFLRTVFLASSRKTTAAAPPSSFSSCSISSSSSSSSSSHLNSSQSTPTRKTEVWRRRRSAAAVKFGLEEDYGGGGEGSPTSTLCFGGGLRKGYRVKKVKTAILSFVRHGKA